MTVVAIAYDKIFDVWESLGKLRHELDHLIKAFVALGSRKTPDCQDNFAGRQAIPPNQVGVGIMGLKSVKIDAVWQDKSSIYRSLGPLRKSLCGVFADRNKRIDPSREPIRQTLA